MTKHQELIELLLARARYYTQESNADNCSEFFRSRNAALAQAFRQSARLAALHFREPMTPEMYGSARAAVLSNFREQNIGDGRHERPQAGAKYAPEGRPGGGTC